MYLVSSGIALPCCRLPLALHVCPTCSQGIKQTRGFTWIEPAKLFTGDCTDPARAPYCPASDLAALGRAGLLWIGEKFYPSPSHFTAESDALGISRRLSALPRDLVIGKTWVFLAHPKACMIDGEWTPGVFRIFKPERVEKIVKQSDLDIVTKAAEGIGGYLPARAGEAFSDNEMKMMAAFAFTPERMNVLKMWNADKKRGIVWVPVPDGDPDHKSTDYDDDAHENNNWSLPL